MTVRIKRSGALAAVAALSSSLLLAGGGAEAQTAATYPSKRVNVVVALAAGGAADLIGRAVTQRLQEMWGQPFVIENRGGANTQVATRDAARAEPDGHALLITAEHTFTITPHLQAKLGYDPQKDFVPISGLVAVSHALTVHPSLPVRSIGELVALSKSRPLTYASLGAGSSPHLSMAMFQSVSGLKADPVQYRGGGPAVADVVAGHVPMVFIATGLVLEHWRAGKLMLLGNGSAQRLPELPDLPAISETYPGFQAGVWFGVFGPAAMPRDIVAKLNGTIQRVLAEPEFTARFMAPNLFEAVPGTPEQLAGKIREDSIRWRKVLVEASLVPKE